MGGFFPSTKQRIYSSYKCSKSKGFIAFYKCFRKTRSPSDPGHCWWYGQFCRAFLVQNYVLFVTVILTTSNVAHKPLAVKIIVFILCFPEIIHVRNYLDDFGNTLLFTGLCSDNLYRTFRPSPLFLPPRPPWRGAHSCLRGHIGAYLTGGNTRFCRELCKCRNYALLWVK